MNLDEKSEKSEKSSKKSKHKEKESSANLLNKKRIRYKVKIFFI